MLHSAYIHSLRILYWKLDLKIKLDILKTSRYGQNYVWYRNQYDYFISRGYSLSRPWPFYNLKLFKDGRARC